jgi:hypothetical protein
MKKASKFDPKERKSWLGGSQPSPDGDRLILNAGKGKMPQAQGFGRNS